MVEVAHRQIEVRREKYGVEGDGRGIPGPRSVDEAVNRLRTFEERAKTFREGHPSKTPRGVTDDAENDIEMSESPAPQSKSSVPGFKQGTLIHRTENELKTHTSYLVFAILPRAWTEADEQRCREKWPSRGRLGSTEGEKKKSKKQLKKETAEKERQEEALKKDMVAVAENVEDTQ